MDFPRWFAEIIRQNAQPNAESVATPVVSMISSPSYKVEMSTPLIDTLTVHVGPKGGKYRLNSKGKKIYLSA